MTFFCHPDCPTVQGWIDEERTEGMHTPEPWKVDPDDRPGYEWNNHIVSATDPNQTICFMTHDNTPENIEGEANARRIVACVNACNGIKTESLEMEVLSWITDETGQSSLKRERDELLEARAACGERLIEVLKERDELLAGRLIEEPLRRRISELLVTLQGVIDRCAPSGYVGQDGQYLKRVRAVVARLGAGETVTDEAV